MAFVFAFLIGGAAVALGQLVKELKVPNPVALIAFIVIGGILTPLGIMDQLSALGAGGVCLFAYGLGNAAYGVGAAAAAGAAQGLIMVVALLVVLISLGAACGIGKKLPEPPDDFDKPEKESEQGI